MVRFGQLLFLGEYLLFQVPDPHQPQWRDALLSRCDYARVCAARPIAGSVPGPGIYGDAGCQGEARMKGEQGYACTVSIVLTKRQPFRKL